MQDRHSQAPAQRPQELCEQAVRWCGRAGLCGDGQSARPREDRLPAGAPGGEPPRPRTRTRWGNGAYCKAPMRCIARLSRARAIDIRPTIMYLSPRSPAAAPRAWAATHPRAAAWPVSGCSPAPSKALHPEPVAPSRGTRARRAPLRAGRAGWRAPGRCRRWAWRSPRAAASEGLG